MPPPLVISHSQSVSLSLRALLYLKLAILSLPSSINHPKEKPFDLISLKFQPLLLPFPMAFKAVLFLLATFVLITTRVSSSDEDPKMKAPSPPYAKDPVPAPAPAKLPAKPPTPSPPSKATPPPAKPPAYAPLPPVKSTADCVPLCDQRCKLHSRKRLCMRACMTCCDRCKCVPPGTYGNQEMCGKCYTDMTTHGNRVKCP